EKIFGPTHLNVALCLNNLAALYKARGDDQQAEPLYQRALTIREKTFGPNHTEVAQSLNNLARLYQDRGDYQQAKPLYQRVLTIYEKSLGPEHPNTAVCLHNLATLYAADGQLAQAIHYRVRCNDTSERDLMHNLITGSENQKALYLKKTVGYTDQTISLHLQSAPQSIEAQRAALAVVLRRKGRALDAMTMAIETLRQQQSPEVQKLMDDYATLTGQISVLTLRGPGKKKPEEHLANLNELEAQKEKLENDISRRSGEFQVQTQPITLENIQKAIPSNAVLVEFAIYKPYDSKKDTFETPRFVAYVLNPQGVIRFVDLGDVEPIDQVVSTLRKTLSNPKANLEREVKPAAQVLDKLVMKPVRGLVGNANHLLISPDGPLNLIPFSALVDEKGNFLVENYTLTYLTSGRDLLRLAVKIDSRQPPLVMADPNYLDGDGPRMLGHTPGRLVRLAGTRVEGEQLKVIFPDAVLKVRTEATEHDLKQVNRPAPVHIATHGYFLEDALQTAEKIAVDQSAQRILPSDLERERDANPLLRSMLFFAGANQGGTADNDGVMTALEAAQLNLWGTKLVTLSACDTGLGDV
ncbi:MAG TPA: CHAT domain-containing protein, partial [Acidobacteriota bacterium]|nr:CHAT domain-containing protein [Acidobacteriota bacterium]